MNHPFQCIAAVKPSPHRTGYLLAACGPKLLSTCLESGAVVAEWTAESPAGQSSTPVNGKQDGDGDEEARPAKKQKTAASTSSPPTAGSLPKIIKLAISPDNRHAIIVTDDKCVRVFEVSNDGALAEISQRTMPKRPCAIQVLPDNATILCGDKFGDVYSLPLLPILKPEAEEQLQNSAETSTDVSKPFKPSATPLTVHTKRNLKSLEAQQKQKNLTPKSKQPLAFEHKLLLGHVSMLTDMAFATRDVEGKQRGYIITADRDEHIRVSRGPPQSHVIEGYCLGHTQFVSKACVVPGTDLLVSGGGDEWLGVWKWPEFRLEGKVDEFGEWIRKAHKHAIGVELENIAVSGIWIAKAIDDGGHAEDLVIVACERVPVVACCLVSNLLMGTAMDERRWRYEAVDYPILDVVSVGTTTILSFDVREPGTRRLQAVKLQPGNTPDCGVVVNREQDSIMTALMKTTNGFTHELESEKTTDDFLYGIANLRKRANHEDETAEAEAADGD